MPLAAPGNRSKSHAKLLHTCQIQVASADLVSYLNMLFALVFLSHFPEIYITNKFCYIHLIIRQGRCNQFSLQILAPAKSLTCSTRSKNIASVLLSLIILDPGVRGLHWDLGSHGPYSSS